MEWNIDSFNESTVETNSSFVDVSIYNLLFFCFSYVWQSSERRKKSFQEDSSFTLDNDNDQLLFLVSKRAPKKKETEKCDARLHHKYHLELRCLIEQIVDRCVLFSELIDRKKESLISDDQPEIELLSFLCAARVARKKKERIGINWFIRPENDRSRRYPRRHSTNEVCFSHRSFSSLTF